MANDKLQSATDDQISKVLDASIGGHGFWLVNHRKIIEKMIADRIEVAGISQTMMDVGYSWLRSEDEPYTDLELDMYEAIAKYNGDVDKEGRMTKKAEIYKVINKRIRKSKVKGLENIPITEQRIEEKQDPGNKPLQSKDLAQQAIELIKEYKNNPNDVKEYLDFMSKFPELSPRNLALLEKQWPGANMIATYNQWTGKTSDQSKNMVEVLKINTEDIDVTTRTITDKKSGKSNTIILDKVSVRQGEKSKISLIRGQENRYIEKKRNGKIQPHWEKFWSKEEKTKVESGEIQAKSSMKYVPYKVFEISQTNIKPESLPKLMPNRHINFEADPKLLKSITTGLENYASSIGVEVSKTTPEASSRTLGNAKGAATIDGKKITMNHLNTPSENVSTLIHELAHSTLHKGGSANQMSEQYAKQEFEAEMTSYVVSKRYGIDTSSQAIPYIAGWTENMKKFSGVEGEKELSQSLSRVQKASHAMIKKIDAQINPVLKQTQKEASNENLEKLSIKEQQGELLDIEAQAERLNLKLTDTQREKIQELPPEGRKHLLESLGHINDISQASTISHEQNKAEADLDMEIF